MTIRSIFKGRSRAAVREGVLAVLREKEPLAAHEIAHFVSDASWGEISSDDVRCAIKQLRNLGHCIFEHSDGAQVLYWLDDSGDAA